MFSGKILPSFRQILGDTLSTKNNPEQRSQNQGQEKPPEREPSREEVEAACEVMNSSEEFLGSGLKAHLCNRGNQYGIMVSDGQGMQLRFLKGAEILRLLGLGSSENNSQNRTGRILDRRI